MSVVGVSFEGDEAQALLHVRTAKQRLEALKSTLAAGGIESGKAFLRLSDTAYCFVVKAMGVELVHIVASPGVDTQVRQVVEVQREPDFLSGFVQYGYIVQTSDGKDRTCDSLYPTQRCAQLQNRFIDRTAQVPLIANEANKVRRLAIEPAAGFAELESKNPRLTYSQYTQLKPSMYSGRMCAVVQALMGFGKQPRRTIYSKITTRQENQPAAPTKALPATEHERLLAKEGQQIAYDYRFFRTHGIVKAADDRLWLVEVGGTRGILAMPLPLIASTTAPEFRQQLEALPTPNGIPIPDEDGLRLLDEFGGYPSGEAFPTTAAEIDAFVRAGVMFRLASTEDMRPFYDNSPYSSAMGWAFSESGHEAHNTAYRFDDDDIQTGVHYGIAFRIGATVQESEQVKKQLEDRRRRTKMALYAGKADFDAAHPGEPKRFEAMLAKIDRMTAEQLDQHQANYANGAAAALAALDQLELQPVTTASAKLSLVGQGRIHWPAKFQPQIKFPEPLLGYLVSHDMRPGLLGRFKTVKCHTTMHVFFVGNELKMCKFYRTAGGRSNINEVDTDEEDCMYVGTWNYTQRSGNSDVPAMFYTTDFDHREELPGQITTRITKGRSLGYTSVQVGDVPGQPHLGFMTRTKSFRMTVDTKTIGGTILHSAITVPFFDRQAYYYTVAQGAQSISDNHSEFNKSLGDPYTYTTWRNFPGYTGFLPSGCQNYSCWRLADHPAGCGKVLARTVLEEFYGPYQCSDFADSGGWAGPCDNADAMVYSIQLPENVGRSSTKPGVVARQTWLVSATDFSPRLVKKEDKDVLSYENPWFLPSPNPDDPSDVHYIAATHNCLGDKQVLIYDSAINGGRDDRVVVGDTGEALRQNIPTFIGVV